MTQSADSTPARSPCKVRNAGTGPKLCQAALPTGQAFSFHFLWHALFVQKGQVQLSAPFSVVSQGSLPAGQIRPRLAVFHILLFSLRWVWRGFRLGEKWAPIIAPPFHQAHSKEAQSVVAALALPA